MWGGVCSPNHHISNNHFPNLMRKCVQERNMGLHHNNERFEIIVKLSEDTVVALQS